MKTFSTSPTQKSVARLELEQEQEQEQEQPIQSLLLLPLLLLHSHPHVQPLLPSLRLEDCLFSLVGTDQEKNQMRTHPFRPLS